MFAASSYDNRICLLFIFLHNPPSRLPLSPGLRLFSFKVTQTFSTALNYRRELYVRDGGGGGGKEEQAENRMILGRKERKAGRAESGTRGSLTTNLRLQTALNSTQPPTMLLAWLCLYQHMRTHTCTRSIKWVAPVLRLSNGCHGVWLGFCFFLWYGGENHIKPYLTLWRF